jgi:hypothetical protein
MQNDRSNPSAVPEGSKLSEQALLKEADLQGSVEFLQSLICDLLIENEKLRQLLVEKHPAKPDPLREKGP